MPEFEHVLFPKRAKQFHSQPSSGRKHFGMMFAYKTYCVEKTTCYLDKVFTKIGILLLTKSFGVRDV